MLGVSETLEDIMNMKRTPATKNRWLLIIPTAIVVLILNVGIHILYIVVGLQLSHQSGAGCGALSGVRAC
jgi:hypothetical protein